ncbi:MAG TPA: hypothetical protein VMZ28_16895 [Kofleriaceae bacterium]|nr:hypothetical protein [Kofleriaceae bacterium]
MIAALGALAACDGKVCDVGEARCDELVAENCLEGYPGEIYWSSDDCTDSGYCVITGSDEALCTYAPAPDPACAGDPSWHIVCDDGVQLVCESGYRVEEEDCGAPDLCRVDVGVGMCLLLPDPDPLCEDITSFDHACDGELAVTCFDGWRVEAQTCGAPELCHEFEDGFAACTTSADPDPRCAGVTDNLDPEANYCDGDTHLICQVDTGLMLVFECENGCGFEYGRNKCLDNLEGS